MGLTLEEQETIILYNNKDKVAEVYSSQRSSTKP